MNRFIPRAIDDHIPDFVLYNAGTDCLVDDPLGRNKIIIFFFLIF